MCIRDSLSNFEWLDTAESWVDETQVKRLMRWCKALRLSEVWVGDTGWHLKNCAERALENALMDGEFVMANSPLSHGDCTFDTRKTAREEMPCDGVGETAAGVQLFLRIAAEYRERYHQRCLMW